MISYWGPFFLLSSIFLLLYFPDKYSIIPFLYEKQVGEYPYSTDVPYPLEGFVKYSLGEGKITLSGFLGK